MCYELMLLITAGYLLTFCTLFVADLYNNDVGKRFQK